MVQMPISATRRDPKSFDLRHWSGKIWPKWEWWCERVEAINWYARYRAMVAEHRPKIFANRDKMFFHLCPKGQIVYLEFGVFKGESLLRWLHLNQHEASSFHGFDSWQGMKGEEGAPFERGEFEAAPPEIDDQRCELHEGWFHDTLPTFDGYPRSHKLIVHLDADEYGPTLYVLTTIDQHVRKGTIIMLDEASVAQCEYRAMLDWALAYGREYRIVAGWKFGRRVEGIAIEVTK